MNNKYSFSGHETFPLRQMWPYKALKLIQNFENPFNKDIDKSIVEMGLGKNMVRSIAYWIIATGLFTKNNSNHQYSQTQLGRIILDEKEGDPFLEKSETLWMLHYELCIRKHRNTSIYWLFNINNNRIFSFDDYHIGIQNLTNNNYQLNVNTLKKDFQCLTNMYSPRRIMKKPDMEDAVQNPFWNLGLIKEVYGQKGFFEIVKKKSLDVPKISFNYALLKFINNYHSKSISFEELLNSPGSPGRVFQLNELPLRMYLENLHVDFNEKLRFDETFGMRQLFIQEQIDPVEYLKRNI